MKTTHTDQHEIIKYRNYIFNLRYLVSKTNIHHHKPLNYSNIPFGLLIDYS